MTLKELLLNQEYFQELQFENEKMLKEDVHYFNLVSCTIKNCCFEDIIFHQGNFCNCTFINCKFINTSFFNIKIEKNHFLDCDFLSCKFAESAFFQNNFENTLQKYHEMNKNKIDLDKYENCDIIESNYNDCIFQELKLDSNRFKKVNFQCSFIDTNFSNTSLKDCYFDIKGFKKCILTPSQGLELLSLYDISFKE